MSDSARKHQLLRGPLLKIERAKYHINDLCGQIDEYLSTKPIEFWISQSKSPPQRTIYVKALPPIPDSFALIAGDAINNIRAALDHICYAMVDSKIEDDRERGQIAFPFTKKADDLAAAIKKNKMNFAPAKVVAEIHALKPYPDGNKHLSAIQALSNADKHRGLLTAVSGAEMTWLQLEEFFPGVAIPPHPPNTKIRTIGDFCRNLDPNDPIENFDRRANCQPTCVIGFGQGEALENDPLVAALNQMVEAAEEAVRRLARAYVI